MKLGTGTRVYWHGAFPDPSMTGTVVSPGSGDIMTPIRWDHRDKSGLEWNGACMPVRLRRKHGDCGYCTEQQP